MKGKPTREETLEWQDTHRAAYKTAGLRWGSLQLSDAALMSPWLELLPQREAHVHEHDAPPPTLSISSRDRTFSRGSLWRMFIIN
eukprot:3941470-Karenia_brevis.AAC.1